MTPAARRVACAVFIFALALRAAASAPQLVVPINGAPPGPRTGLIVGQVVDAATGSPIPEAIVFLTLPKYSLNLPTTPNAQVLADGEGRFFFADLPAGDYFVRATKPGYADGTYGQRQVNGDYQPFALGEGERRTDATLALWKYGAITGTVVDEAGEPVVGVKVQALSRDFLAGRARFGKMTTQPWAVPTAITDDRGMYRIAQLPPAGYIVVAPSAEITVPVGVLNTYAQDQTLLNELVTAVMPNGSSDWKAELQNTPIGQSRSQQVGDFALITMDRVAIPPPATAVGRMSVYETTFYPAASSAAAAALIALKAGEERADANIALRPVAAVRVSGRLVTPDGTPPAPTSMRLVGESAADVSDAGFETAIGMSDSSGRFTMFGVPAGEYTLKSANPFLMRPGTRSFYVDQRVSVGARDVDDLVVTPRPALRVSGRVEYHGVAGQPRDPRSLPRFVTFAAPFGDQSGFAPNATYVDGTAFSTVMPAGQYIIQPLEMAGWFVESVSLNGKDVTDKAVDITEDAGSLVVTYTDRPSSVTGTVKDARGDASPASAVLAFPANPERWSGYGAGPRDVVKAVASRTGAYKFDNLPAGDYFLIAIDGANAGNWTDPKNLEALARQAARLTVAAGEPATLDLTLKVIR